MDATAADVSVGGDTPTEVVELMEVSDLMQEAVTLRRVAKPLAEVPPMQEAVTLRVLQWPLTEVVVHQDGADGVRLCCARIAYYGRPC